MLFIEEAQKPSEETKRPRRLPGPQLVEEPKSVLSSCKITGGARGGEARLELDQMPRKALRGKACGERSEDFRAALQNENLALLQTVKKVRTDFFDSL